jgi:translation initiation factor 1A
MQEEIIRVRLPRGREVLGTIVEILGGSRLRVTCKDGNMRICRIPGKFRKRLNMSIGDKLIIEPWDVQGDERGDVIWIYNKTQASWLVKNGYY